MKAGWGGLGVDGRRDAFCAQVAGLGDALRSLGQTADGLSVAAANQTEEEVLQLEEPISEYCRLVSESCGCCHRGATGVLFSWLCFSGALR